MNQNPISETVFSILNYAFCILVTSEKLTLKC